MTRYVKLYNNDDEDSRVSIHVVFGREVGAWCEGRNPTNLKIGRELIGKAQRKLRHNRRKMGNPYKWRPIIEEITSKYQLKTEEKVVV
jgi:hypothetical protein